MLRSDLPIQENNTLHAAMVGVSQEVLLVGQVMAMPQLSVSGSAMATAAKGEGFGN